MHTSLCVHIAVEPGMHSVYRYAAESALDKEHLQ